MAGRAAVARVLCAIALFAFALTLPTRVLAAQVVIESPGPLSQIFITDDLSCQIAYAGDLGFEFFPSESEIGSCGTWVAAGGTVWGPVGGSATLVPFTVVSQTPVGGSGTVSDPFRVVTVVDIAEAGLRLSETDSYAVGSRSYRTDVAVANTGSAGQSGVLYRAGDCYLQGNDAGFVRVEGGSPACIVDPAQGRRVEQWLPITVGSHYFAGGYGDVWSNILSQAPFPDTCACGEQVVFDNGAGLSWQFNLAPGATATFSQETFFSPVGGSPTSGQSLMSSVPDPFHITLDPVVVAQSVALTAGVIVLVPFPSALFNNTLEENYAEVMGWVARLQAWAKRSWDRFIAWIRRQIASRRAPTTATAPAPPTGPMSGEAFVTATAVDPWQSPLRIAGFIGLTALLYAFLDPTFGFSLNSLAELVGLALGLFAVMLAWGVPLLIMSRHDRFALTMRALPATLIVGVACVLISRFANFQPGYLYGLIVGFFIAHGIDARVDGRAKAVAAATTLVVALAGWIVLALLRGSAGGADFVTVLLEAAAVTVVVAGLENAVFAMLPLRFMPGEAVFKWDRRVWIALMAIGLFGFVHVLLNPAAGAGYLADSTRTSFVTLILLLAFFGIASVLFWAYFRFRPKGHAA
ncbi:MAG: FGLLP motif-containing membrane protein [Chloroflexota bacterium]